MKILEKTEKMHIVDLEILNQKKNTILIINNLMFNINYILILNYSFIFKKFLILTLKI